MRPESDKPKILLITRNLPPLVGGMERLMLNMAQGMAEYAEVTVIGPRGCSSHLPKQVTVLESSAKLAPFLLGASGLAFRACRKHSFNVIIGGSGLMAPTLSLLSLFCSSRTIIYLHGLDLVVNSFLYQTFFVPRIRGIDKLIANSSNTRRIAISKGIPEHAITIINPGTLIPERPDANAAELFRQKYSINFGKVVIFVGRMTRRKGLSQFILHCLPAILAAEPSAGLVVVGENPNNSLNKLGEHDAVIAAMQQSRLEKNILFLGHLDDPDLLSCYAAADVQVLPLVETPGDIEGFGMIAIEAAACGTPTIAFDLGGVGDAISTHNGQLIAAGDHNAFADAVVASLQQPGDRSSDCISHAQEHSWEKFNAKVEQALQPFLQDGSTPAP